MQSKLEVTNPVITRRVQLDIFKTSGEPHGRRRFFAIVAIVIRYAIAITDAAVQFPTLIVCDSYKSFIYHIHNFSVKTDRYPLYAALANETETKKELTIKQSGWLDGRFVLSLAMTHFYLRFVILLR